jgi:hypothetical protein
MNVTYLAVQNIYDSLGISDNIGIHLHATGHALTLEDTKYLVEFCNKNLYGVVDGKMNYKHHGVVALWVSPVFKFMYVIVESIIDRASAIS